MNRKILVIGSLNVDQSVQVTSLPAPGETIKGHDLRYLNGGKGANQAVACGRLSIAAGTAAMLGCVGDDDFGKMQQDSLSASGVDTQYIRRISGTPTGMALICVDSKGANTIVIIAGANECVTPDLLEESGSRKAIEEADILLLQMEIPFETNLAVVDLAAKSGKTIILNPAPAPDHSIPEEFFAKLDYITPNENELARLTGMPCGTIDEISAAAGALLQKGVRNGLVTIGERGALLANQDGIRHIPGIPADAIDTTAAGDTFNGAFAVALSEGKNVEDAIDFANRAAAISVTRRGAQDSVPYRTELTERT